MPGRGKPRSVSLLPLWGAEAFTTFSPEAGANLGKLLEAGVSMVQRNVPLTINRTAFWAVKVPGCGLLLEQARRNLILTQDRKSKPEWS